MRGSARDAARLPLSVCVLAYDDEALLARCLDALGFADDLIVVVDSRSRDGSEKIARERAQRVDVHAYRGDIEQKQHAVSLAEHEWVMLIDSDEVVTPQLASRIAAFMAARVDDDGVAGGEFNRLTLHLGRWLRHGDFHPDWILRLFRKDRARWVGSNPHNRIEVIGEVERIEGDLEHYSYRDLADQVARIQRFSDAAAAAMLEEGRPFRVFDLLFRPPARFLRAYVVKRGFLDGLPGLIVAVATAMYVFLKYAKRWELGHRRS